MRIKVDIIYSIIVGLIVVSSFVIALGFNYILLAIFAAVFVYVSMSGDKKHIEIFEGKEINGNKHKECEGN